MAVSNNWNRERSGRKSRNGRRNNSMVTMKEGQTEKAESAARWREIVSSALVILFYVLFLIFVWYGIYQTSLAFYTGADTGIPGNPEVIPAKLVVPALQSAAWAIAAMGAYAFLFANPRRGAGSSFERLSRQDLRGKALSRRLHFWTIPWWAQAVLLFVFSYYIRTLVIQLIGQDTIQVMDFERVFYASLQDAPVSAEVQGVNFYQAFPNWALHVKLLHLLNVNFGGTPLTGITYNAIASSISVVLLYLVLYFATDREAFAVIAALIFSCWPFYLFYMVLLSPDFSFLLLFLLSALFIVIGHRFARALWLRLGLYGLSGVLLSLAGFFKSIDKILIIALVIGAVLSFIAFGRFDRKRAVCGVLAAVVFAAAWVGTGKLVYREIEAYVGGEVNTDVSPYFLNVGMNLDTYGQWSEEILGVYLTGVRETGYDFETVNEEMRGQLKVRVEEVMADMKARERTEPETKWDFFGVKLQKAWANNEGIRFIMQTIHPENPLYDMEFYEKYYPQIQAYQVVVAFLMAVGAAVALLTRERKAVLVSALMVFGFGLLLLISEVQPRYKTVVFPFMAAVAAYGVYGVLRPFQRLGAIACKRLFTPRLVKK